MSSCDMPSLREAKKVARKTSKVASQARRINSSRARIVGAASDGHGIGGGVFEAGRGVAKMIEKGEARGFFDPDAPGANVLVRKRRGDNLGGL